MLSKQIDLTIIIPAYNEEKRIGDTLGELAIYLKTNDLFKTKNVEVLVVAAEPQDRTYEIVESKQGSFNDLDLLKPGPSNGKGGAVCYGMLRAKGRNIIFMDADLATPLHHLQQFYLACEDGSDVVIGTRNLFKYRPSFIRRLTSSIGNILFRAAGGIWIEDSQCGFKMFSSQAARLCFSKLTITGWGFDMEVLAIARANKLRIASYRIDDWRDQPDSTFTESVWITSFRSIGDLSRIVANRLRCAYYDRK